MSAKGKTSTGNFDYSSLARWQAQSESRRAMQWAQPWCTYYALLGITRKSSSWLVRSLMAHSNYCSGASPQFREEAQNRHQCRKIKTDDWNKRRVLSCVGQNWAVRHRVASDAQLEPRIWIVIAHLNMHFALQSKKTCSILPIGTRHKTHFRDKDLQARVQALAPHMYILSQVSGMRFSRRNLISLHPICTAW